MRSWIVLGTLSLLGCGGEVVTVPVEPGSPAIQDGRLAESVGLETRGGTFTPLLEAGCELPCEISGTYSTAPYKATELSLALYRGNDRLTVQNYFLGRYLVSEIPAVERGVPQVELTLRADTTGLHLFARDPAGGAVRLRRLY